MHTNGQFLLFDTAAVRARLARFHAPRVEKDQLATSFCRFVANQIQKPRRGGVENLPIEPGLLLHVLSGLLDRAARRARDVGDGEALGEDAGVRRDHFGALDVPSVLAAVRKPAPPARQMFARLRGALRAFATPRLGKGPLGRLQAVLSSLPEAIVLELIERDDAGRLVFARDRGVALDAPVQPAVLSAARTLRTALDDKGEEPAVALAHDRAVANPRRKRARLPAPSSFRRPTDKVFRASSCHPCRTSA